MTSPDLLVTRHSLCDGFAVLEQNNDYAFPIELMYWYLFYAKINEIYLSVSIKYSVGFDIYLLVDNGGHWCGSNHFGPSVSW